MRRKRRLSRRIEARRQNGDSAAVIARYVFNRCGTSWSTKFSWTHAEREELERLDREAASRQAKRAQKVAEAAGLARQAIERSAPPLPRPANLGRGGLSKADVRKALGCKETELRRWIESGRLPPDGQRFYYGVGPRGGSKWHPAWKIDTISAARGRVDEWRAGDASETPSRWSSEASLFCLVKSRYPDAVFQWSPQWLGRLKVDIYVPSLNVAFEYQGEQHYRPVPAFGGEDGFRATQARDVRKREQLQRQGVVLIEWRFDTPISRIDPSS